MHRCCLVMISNKIDKNDRGVVEQIVGELLEPHEGDGWDWWQIGGRWTGVLTDYKPDEDPNNIETCDLCSGTGTRPGGKEEFGEEWFKWCNGCNGCLGKGTHTKWPSRWKEYEGDIQPVEKVIEGWKKGPLGSVLVTPNSKWIENDSLFGEEVNEEWSKEVLENLEKFPDHWVVVVDTHF